MLFVPLPFVVACLLCVLIVRMVRSAGSSRRDVIFLALVVVYALQSVLIGLRWGYDVRAVLPLQAVLAATLASLAWLAFRELTAEGARGRLVPHVLPAASVLLFVVLWREAVGPALIAIFLGYGLRMARLAWNGPDALVEARLDGAIRSYRALQITAGAILSSAVIDLLIGIDGARFGGAHSGAMVALANGVALLCLGMAAAATQERETHASTGPSSRAHGVPDCSEPVDAGAEQDADLAILASLDDIMARQCLWRDAELNLRRLARRMGLPARRLSLAVNRARGVSVSQYVNTLRIEDACRQLSGAETPVTTIMFATGFSTKSNFNREFLRVTGLNPTQWRKANAGLPFRLQEDVRNGSVRLE